MSSVSASTLLMPDATLPSEAITKRPMSPVALQCVPPQSSALKPGTLVWVGTLLKLMATPLLVVAVSHFTGLSGIAFEAAMITAAVPTAMNGYVLARTMGGDAELYAATATLQTALAFVTIPLWIWLARGLLAG